MKAGFIANAIRSSKKTTVLTGAGISTESGIPDFRSPDSGIWTRFDPFSMTSEILNNNPEKFYKSGLKFLEFLYSMRNSKPNEAHIALVEMEKLGFISTVITQNIDSLHKKAGSKNVIEIHGDLLEAYCMKCKGKTSFDELVKKVSSGEIPPGCDFCNQKGRRGILRPNLVLFGDMLPDSFNLAVQEARESELLVVIGSSLEISPANQLPMESEKVIIINREKTHYDDLAGIVWQESAGKALMEILDELKK
jgi:NAD-dependent deacetylase